MESKVDEKFFMKVGIFVAISLIILVFMVAFYKFGEKSRTCTFGQLDEKFGKLGYELNVQSVRIDGDEKAIKEIRKILKDNNLLPNEVGSGYQD